MALGQRLLKAEGPSALTIGRLTEVAGKTRGSFYHHFSSRDDFLEAMVADWQKTSTDLLGERLAAAPDEAARLDMLKDVSVQWDGAFERNLRQLAASDAVVALRLAEVDEVRIQGLAREIAARRPDVDDPYAYAFVQYAAIVGGQWLLNSIDDPRLPAIRKAGNAIFGLTD